MIILNKKRVLIIFVCVIISIFCAEINVQKQTIQTVAMPVENKVIILDARTWFAR